MHGIIHSELKKYVEAKHGFDAWPAVLQEAGLAKKMYLLNSTYPDHETIALVAAASKLTNVATDLILEDFGEFIAPTLMSLYRLLLKPEWKTMEMLLHTEETIHRVVRMRNPGAEPPELRFEQTGPNQVKLYYNSRRGMAAVAKGIIKGIAKYYGQTVSLSEDRNSDGSSEILVTIT